MHYYNLTGMGVTHSGKTGVNYWFRDFIAPTLGEQTPVIGQLQFDGQIDSAQSPASASVGQSILVRRANTARADRVYGPAQVVQSDQPELSGTAAPGSIIRLAVEPRGEPNAARSRRQGRSPSSTGQWSLTTNHPLVNGQYRVLVDGLLSRV